MTTKSLGGSANPRKWFINDIYKTINDAQSQGDEVILGFVANAVIGEDVDKLDRLIREGRLYELAYDIPERVGDPSGSYKISDRRLDYILGTEGTRKAVV